ncbi:alpha/beta fold hydrolase [Subtercola frigoramans]|uniref:Alpha-beta hydrolase superfamily lysophospholipase n=1 Tax=Subtercola frigoramans TaxID=120298 RepID=A0ABS2L9V0_9MICO|nr:alpha/beta fold hydrolase [Subtercola frigoramans]MBM7473646.1 alpha-beta hydrolase superfamily lysophospholipase [Subtercola frigoramans]
MAIREVEFASHNGRDVIQSWIYEPVVPARAIVHVVHGLGEHSRRYLRLIEILLDAGFVVAADDHAGHGRTAAVSGVWADAGEDAEATVVADERTLHGLVRELHPDLPYVVFGHSWGSMIARVFAASVGSVIDGLILGGIAAQIESVDKVVDRRALAAEPDPMAPAPGFLLEQAFRGFIDRYPQGSGPLDWVALSADVVRDHAADPFNNFAVPMSVRFLRGFIGIYDTANSDDWYAAVRNDLPVLILAGDQDPVANYGEGAYHVANRLVASGTTNVRTRVYSGFRHEVHNEPAIRDDVAGEIVSFVKRVIG